MVTGHLFVFDLFSNDVDLVDLLFSGEAIGILG